MVLHRGDVSVGVSWDNAIPGKKITDADAEMGFSRSFRSGITGSNPSLTDNFDRLKQQFPRCPATIK
jgi:hypothetical protein